MNTSDFHTLRAAEGWLELGDWRSAHDELEQLASDLQSHPEVLRLRFSIYSAAEEWEMALRAAEAHVGEAPDDRHAWINRSFALHELKETEAAEAQLLQALDKFPDESLIPYNLACYACVLGRLEVARALLERAFTVGDQKELERMAAEDPDLAALWDGMRPKKGLQK